MSVNNGAYEQALDKIEKLKAENVVLKGFAESVLEWSRSYPKSVFPEPSPEEISRVCKGLGLTVDSIAASILRVFVTPWGKSAGKVLSCIETIYD